MGGGASPRAPRRREAVAAALFVALLAGVFWPVIRAPGEVLFAPRSDLLAFAHPYRALQHRAWAETGAPTLWDPTQFAGRPLAGDPQSALFYPPDWLHYLDRMGEGEWIHGWSVLLHVLLGGLGVLFWLRRQGVSAPASLCGALVFALGGQWAHHVLAQGHVVFLGLMWLPWQCAGVDLLLERPTPRRAAGLAIATALVLLGTHSQIAFYSQLLVVAWALTQLLARHRAERMRGLAALSAAAAWAVALAAVQWLPLAAGLDFFVRGEGLAPASAAAGGMRPAALLAALVSPAAPAVHEPGPHFGALVPALAAMAIFAARERRLRVFSATVVLVVALYGLGEHGFLQPILYRWVPGFDLFRLPARAWLVAALPLAALVAAGCDALARAERSAALRAVASVLALLGIASAARAAPDAQGWLLLAWLLPAAVVLPPWPAGWRARAAWGVALLVALDVARVAAPLVETRPLDEALGGNPLVARLAAPLGEGRVLAWNRRSAGDMSALPATYTTRAGIESVRGFSPLVPRATWEFLLRGAADVEPETRPRVTIPSFVPRRRQHLDLLNVRWVVSGPVLDLPGLELRETFGPLDVHHYQVWPERTTLGVTHLYENVRRMPRAALVREARLRPDGVPAVEAVVDLDPRASVLVEDPALVGRFAGDFEAVPVDHRWDEIRLDVDAGAGGYLVLSELWHPGWRAEVDGAPAEIHRANGIFQMVRLEPGRHAVVLRFRPRSFLIGAAVSVAAWLGLLAAMRWG